MAKWLLVVETNCVDTAREAEFNEWYDKTHLPDVLETPGFVRATRYENTNPPEGKGRFLATYEIGADDIDQVMKVHADTMTRKKAAGRYSELVMVVSRGVYRQTSSLSK